MQNIFDNLSTSTYSIAQISLYQNLIERGFAICQDHIRLFNHQILALIEKLGIDGHAIYDLNQYSGITVVQSAKQDIVLIIDHKQSTMIAFTLSILHINILYDFLSFYKKYISCTNETNTIDYFYAAGGYIENRTIHRIIENENTILPELYPDIDIAKLADKFNTSKENILILYGLPGTGKTSFIKYFLQHYTFKKIGYSKDPKVMENDDFWSSVIDENYNLLIFDDFNTDLKERNPFINSLLSYSDGIFERNSKIIITTNQKIEEIDPALIRPGRCFDFLILNPLTNAQALNIWTTILKMPENDFKELYGENKSITQATLMSDYYRIKDNQKERSYIKSGEKKYNLPQKLSYMGIEIDSQRGAGFGK